MPELEYYFEDIAQVNEGIRQQLRAFETTLEDFKTTYLRLAGNWGGKAAETANVVAKQLDDFGRETAGVVDRYQRELVSHLDSSVATENSITRMFSG